MSLPLALHGVPLVGGYSGNLATWYHTVGGAFNKWCHQVLLGQFSSRGGERDYD
jgi:hypothetical protein